MSGIHQLVSYMTFTCRLRRRSNLARAAMFCIVVLQTRSRGLEGRGSQVGAVKHGQLYAAVVLHALHD